MDLLKDHLFEVHKCHVVSISVSYFKASLFLNKQLIIVTFMRMISSRLIFPSFKSNKQYQNENILSTF